jgi:hypothetical protein
MMKTTFYARAGATAIAALALCTTAEAAKVDPIIDLSPGTTKPDQAKPIAAQPPANQAAMGLDERTVEFGGGALALLALAGGAWALSRRRRRRDELSQDEVRTEAAIPAEPEFAAQDRIRREPAAMEDRSAFAWADAPHTASDPLVLTNAHRSDETWVERAYRGPSPENPSQSLRKRLKRAAFFDKRERETAAGAAAPVDADAGLPERALELADRRELEAA